MLGRIVVGVRRCEADRPVLQLATALASQTGSGVQVVHVRERRCTKVEPCYCESMEAASRVVEEAVFELRMAGVGASGKVTSTLQGRVAQSILDEADACGADAVVVGWHRRRGLRRLFRTGDRERLMRLSRVPVILVPLVAGRKEAERQGNEVRTQLAR